MADYNPVVHSIYRKTINAVLKSSLLFAILSLQGKGTVSTDTPLEPENDTSLERLKQEKERK